MRPLLAGMLLSLACGPAAAANRIVTLAPHLAELVCAAGGCERLVGVADYTDVLEATAVPRIGNAFAVNAEVVLSLRPDWVLVWDGGTPPEVAARLRALGLPVASIQVRGLDDVPQAIEWIGEALGTAAVAEAAAQAYRTRLAELRARYAGRPMLRAFYQIETAPAYTVNRRSPIDEALRLCGAQNVFADLPMIAAAVNDESVLAARPDVVVVGDFENRAALDAYWARFGKLPAAKNRVVVSSDALTRASPRVLDGVQQLCEGLEAVRRRAGAK